MNYGKHKETLYSKSMLTLLAYLANWLQYIPEDEAIKPKGGPFPGFACLLCTYCTRTGSCWNTATCTADYAIMCVGTSVICLRSIESSLPSLYLYVTRDKLFQALSRFSALQAMESWVGPGNKTSDKVVW